MSERIGMADLNEIAAGVSDTHRERLMAWELIARRKRDALHAAAVALADWIVESAPQVCIPSPPGESVWVLHEKLVAYRAAKAALAPEPDWIDRAVEDWWRYVRCEGDVGLLKRNIRDAYKEQNRDL